MGWSYNVILVLINFFFIYLVDDFLLFFKYVNQNKKIKINPWTAFPSGFLM